MKARNKMIGASVAIALSGFLIGGAVANNANKGLKEKYVDGTISGLYWTLKSGESTALQYQAYNLATEKLEDIVKSNKGDKKLAVILDLDETVINNYGSSIENVLTREGYSKEKFTEWVNKEEGTAIAGSVEFLNRAKELGVEIFYVSNRYPEDMTGTINNLKKLGIPNADEEHVLLRTDSSKKEERVNKIKENHEVVMYIGDNLGDFPSDFDKKSNEERQAIVEENKEKFGAEYIVIPNASYGDWDNATFGYDFNKTEEEKIQDRIKALENYNK